MNPRKLPRGIAGWSSVSLFYAHSAIDMAAIDMTNLARSAGPGPKRDVGGGGRGGSSVFVSVLGSAISNVTVQ